MNTFKLLADENIAAAVIDQLAAQGVEIGCLTRVLPEGVPDSDVLEYAHANGYTLLTHDKEITRHIVSRHREGKGHAGVFIADDHLQGQRGIGTIVTLILEYNELILASAGTVQDDVYNHVTYI